MIQEKEKVKALADDLAKVVAGEVIRSTFDLGFPLFNSDHEGFAILKEEVDELWDEVKNKNTDDDANLFVEAIHVAAMAIKFIISKQNREDVERKK